MINEEDDEWNDYINNIRELGEARTRKIYVKKKIINRSIIKPTNKQISLSGLIKNDKSDMRLRRGDFPIDATLDLHGLTYIKAQDLLLRFIDRSLVDGHKNLLVITGKGLKPDGTLGVIRQNISFWLNDVNLSDKIGAFCHAKNKDGGEGAFYIRLKTIK
jgi:DNA-nicking Smr family endonuclease